MNQLFSVDDIHRKFELRAAIQHLNATSDECWWMTFTFAQNVVEVAYAKWRWCKVIHSLRLRCPKIRAVYVWARQFRGAWHLHMVASLLGLTGLDVEGVRVTGEGGSADWRWLRNMVVWHGWGHEMRFRRVGGTVLDGAKLANYLGHYCTDKNGLDKVRDRGVRRLGYIGKNVRVYDRRWKSMFKVLVRQGKEMDEEMRVPVHLVGRARKRTPGYSGIMMDRRDKESFGQWYRRKVPLWFSLAWEQLEPGEQEHLISEDVSVRRFVELGAISYV
jgi:hypothetical protein